MPAIGSYTLHWAGTQRETVTLGYDFSTRHEIVAGATIDSGVVNVLLSDFPTGDITAATPVVVGTTVNVTITDVSSVAGETYDLVLSATFSDATVLVETILLGSEQAPSGPTTTTRRQIPLTGSLTNALTILQPMNFFLGEDVDVTLSMDTPTPIHDWQSVLLRVKTASGEEAFTLPAVFTDMGQGVMTFALDSALTVPLAYRKDYPFEVRLTDFGKDTVLARGTLNLQRGLILPEAGVATTFLVEPSEAAPDVGEPFTLLVTAKDGFGDTAPLYAGTVHLTSNDPLAVLGPDAPLVNGVGTFAATLSTPGARTVTASDGTITGTGAVVVHPIAATKLAFAVQPTAAAAGATISPAITVLVQNLFGDTVTTSTAAVTLALTLPGGTMLLGTVTRNAVAGVATFDDIAVSPAGTYTFTATSGGLTSAASASFAVGAFTPLSILGCQLWVKADAGVLQTIGGIPATDTASAGQWVDQSGHNHSIAQANATKRPTFLVNQQNGLPAVRFDGVNDLLTLVFPLSQPHTRFCVFKSTSAMNGGFVNADGGADQTSYMFYSATDTLDIYAGAHLTTAATGSAWHIVRATFNGASSKIGVDDGTVVTGDAGTLDADGLTLGAQAGESFIAACSFGEVIEYDSALSDDQVTLVMDYLNNRWAVYTVESSFVDEFGNFIVDEDGNFISGVA